MSRGSIVVQRSGKTQPSHIALSRAGPAMLYGRALLADLVGIENLRILELLFLCSVDILACVQVRICKNLSHSHPLTHSLCHSLSPSVCPSRRMPAFLLSVRLSDSLRLFSGPSLSLSLSLLF